MQIGSPSYRVPFARYFSLLALLTLTLSMLIGCTTNPNATPTAEVPATEGEFPEDESTEDTPSAATATPTVEEAFFEYSLYITDHESAPIPDLTVRIEIEDQATLSGITGSDGYVRISVPTSHAGRPGDIVIPPGAYEAYRVEVDLYPGQQPRTIRLQEQGPPTPPPTPEVVASAEPTGTLVVDAALFIQETDADEKETIHLVAGTGLSAFAPGDDLVVYSQSVTGVEVAIAVVRVIAVNPDTLSAQTILQDPDNAIKANMRVDDRSEQLSGANLRPAPLIPADAYLHREGEGTTGSLYMVTDQEFGVGTQLNALRLDIAGAEIVDAFPDSSIVVRIQAIGVLQKTAQVTLEAGEWPPVGTLFTLPPNVSSAPTQTSVPVPTATSTAPDPDTIATSVASAVEATLVAEAQIAENIAATLTAQAPPPATETPTATPAVASTPAQITPTDSPTPSSLILFDGDPRDSEWLCDGGFRSDCDFENCNQWDRLVTGPFCRNFDYPDVKAGLYRVTVSGEGRVWAGATDYGTWDESFALGVHEISLPDGYTFCWPGWQEGGYGFETVVQSIGTPARVDGIRLEYLGTECN